MLSRAKGHNFELRIINFFRKLGWKSACSSRSESKRLDAAGVDACYTAPFQLQMKAVEQSLNYHQILERMPKNDNFNLVVHKRNRQGVIIAMTDVDFFRFLNMLIESGKIKPC